MYLKKSFNQKRNKTQLSFVQGYRVDGKVKHKVIQNLGYAIIKLVYAKLQIREFFQNKQHQIPAEYNLNSIFSLLLFNRFLFPSSKKNAFETKDSFFDRFDFSLDDVYRVLGYFCRYSQELQRHLHSRISSLIGTDSQKAYYDVTNYYFEIPYEDEDSPDAERKVKRKRGPSKEHRKDPIIQMGLLMDSNGIPMAFHTFSGNESEKTNLLPAIRKVKKDFCLDRIIVVADRGLNTSDNTFLLSEVNASDGKNNDGYYSIVTSEKELSDQEIRDIYKGLWEIEESFKIIKSEFKTRPVFVSTEEHIQAHFLICFVTLVIMRVLEQLTGKGHSVRQIRNSLASYSCSYLDQNYYLFDYRDNVILTMEKTFGLDLSKKIMPLSEIKRISMYQDIEI